MSHIFNADLKADLAQRLARLTPWSPPATDLKQAAVAIAIVPHAQTAGFLLTRRAPRLNAHAGQWALPGGRIDQGETIVEAALREVHEEINLVAQASNVLGVLDPYPTRYGYLITPVVLWIDDLNGMTPNPGEVASLHPFALAELERVDSTDFFSIPNS